MRTFILAYRKSIEANVEDVVTSCCSAAIGQMPEGKVGHFSLAGSPTLPGIVVCSSPDEALSESAVVVPIPIPKLFTWVDPTISMERLRPLFRGVLRSAAAIWRKDKKSGLDFYREGLFYRRPFGSSESLWHQTVVLVDLAHHAGPGTRKGFQDLVLVAFGNTGEGLPRLEQFQAEFMGPLTDVLSTVRHLLDSVNVESLIPVRAIAVSSPFVTTLEGTQAPSWFSFGQWMKRLETTGQGAFIISPLSGPQRVDGPAGSGKTLSIVLKALYTLKQAAAQQVPHHSALVVFSEDTKRKIIDSFLAPLDEDGFYLRDRSAGDLQTLTVTTLLEWSQRELRPIVGSFDLPSANPAQARTDQGQLVKDTLERYLEAFLKSGASVLSQDMRSLCAGKVTPVLVEMFLHEFGVVIKGMADGGLRRYLSTTRPVIALPCKTEADRRFVFALFEKYQELLREYGIVDLDDVAVSHIKLLQMPLRREAREGLAFDSVFVDEAHSFNPNELAIFFLLTRKAELPPLVVAVDLPQAIGDKGYAGKGLEEAIFDEFEAREDVPMTRFFLEDVRRCPQSILSLVASIYAQGHGFMSATAVPKSLRSARTNGARKPLAKRYTSAAEMLEAILPTCEEIVERLHCSRSDVLIVLMHEGLDDHLPERLVSRSEMLVRRTDLEAERRSQRLNHFVIGRPEYLHGLEFEAVVIVGVSRNDIPRFDQGPVGQGAAAMFETQRVVDLLYLALTRARREAVMLYVREPSFLLDRGVKEGLIEVEPS